MGPQDAVELRFSSGAHSLAGTIIEPARPVAAALIMTGSGPLDRNANMKRQPLGVSEHLAEHLADVGVATFRYDKRGVGASQGDYRATGFHDNVADAAAAVDALRERVGALPLFTVGHSEGAIIATRLCATGVPLDGAVLLAAPARSGKDVVLFQAALAEEVVPAFARRILRLLRVDVEKSQAKRIKRLEASDGDTMRVQLVKINARWFREFMAYDPRSDLPAIRQSLLAITGAKDIQVPPNDLEVVAELAGGPVETQLVPDLTHLLRRDPEQPSLRAYREQMKHPTDPEVLELVGAWIGRITAARAEGAG